ncbi:hypothetical protein DFH06DRAFT_1364559 [Mycena polygramma]|nr:hypothetical protein DFH06DRAFT_1364559 [Mycena polygramma]
MVRRSSKKSKAEAVIIDLTRLSKEGLLVLQRYADHGQRLPTVSAKTSYRDIWKHTRKFNTARRTMRALASKIQSSSHQATETYCSDVLDLPQDEFRSFLATQSRLVDDLLDDCDKMAQLCNEFERESEGDLAALQDEVTKLKVATNAKERRDLLLEMTRAIPVISQVKGAKMEFVLPSLTVLNVFWVESDVFKELLDCLKAIQHELSILEDKSDPTFGRILYIFGVAFSSGMQILA